MIVTDSNIIAISKHLSKYPKTNKFQVKMTITAGLAPRGSLMTLAKKGCCSEKSTACTVLYDCMIPDFWAMAFCVRLIAQRIFAALCAHETKTCKNAKDGAWWVTLILDLGKRIIDDSCFIIFHSSTKQKHAKMLRKSPSPQKTTSPKAIVQKSVYRLERVR